jgi:hypothetical protein
MIDLPTLKKVAETVKISIEESYLPIFADNLQKKIKLAMEIDNVDISSVDMGKIFFNFDYQSLDLLEEPIQEIIPKFYRPHRDNMIIVSKFVDKD